MKNESKLDIVLCIDGTGSMQNIIDAVKQNSFDFIQKIVARLGDQKFELHQVRAKIIIFRNFIVDGKLALQVSPFYNLINEQEKFIEFVNQIRAFGGKNDDAEEDGLEALALAIKSEWTKEDSNIRIIGMWSDTTMHALESKKKRSLHHYPKDIPETFEALTTLWEGEFLSEGIASKLILYTPNGYPWDNIAANWTNVIHYPSTAGVGLHIDSHQIIDDIAEHLINLRGRRLYEKLESLPPEVKEIIEERDKLRKTISSQDGKQNQPSNNKFLTAKWISKLFASFAIFSIAFFSFRLIGFNLFTYKYIKEQTNHYHIKYEKELEEHLKELREEGRIGDKTIIDVETELEKHSGIFNQYANLEVKYVLECEISNFKLGQYSIYGFSDTEEAARVFGNHLNYLDKVYNISNLIDVNLKGATDKTPIINPLIYQGEFGNLKGKPYLYEGKVKEFEIKSKELVGTNEKLGFLRGYSFWDYLRRRVDFFIRESTNYTQEVTTHQSIGGEFRRIEIKVKFYDIKLKE